MRREDKEIKDRRKIESLLARSKVCRIALAENNHPYVVPMLFAHENNCIYIHSANEGKKIDIIRENNQVSFEVDEMEEIITGKKACLFGVKYQSAIGFGKASLITEMDEKRAALDLLMQKYSDRNEWDYFDAALDKISVIKIELDELTGKQSK